MHGFFVLTVDRLAFAQEVDTEAPACCRQLSPNTVSERGRMAAGNR